MAVDICSVWEGIVIGAVGGTLAGLTVWGVGQLQRKWLERLHKYRIYSWLKTNLPDKDANEYIEAIKGFMAEMAGYAKNNHQIIYMIIVLIISAIVAKVGTWQIGLASMVALSLVAVVAGMIEGYIVFFVVIIAATLLLLSFSKIVG